MKFNYQKILIQSLIFLILATPFVLTKPKQALAWSSQNWLSVGGAAELAVSNVQVSVGDNYHDFSSHINISWQTEPHDVNGIYYKIRVYFSNNGTDWTEQVVSNHKVDGVYYITEAEGNCYSANLIGNNLFRAVDKNSIDFGGCFSDKFPEFPNAILDYDGTTIHFREKLHVSDVQQTTETRLVQYQIETRYNPGAWQSTGYGPVINVRVSTGPGSTTTVAQDEKRLQGTYDAFVNSSKTMFEKIEKNKYWTDARNFPEEILKKLVNAAAAGAKEVLEVGNAPKYLVNLLVASGQQLFPTEDGWDHLNTIRQSATSTKKLLEDIKTKLGSTAELPIAFSLKEVPSGNETKQTTSFNEVQTTLTEQIELVNTLINTKVPGEEVGGMCMDKITSKEINILSYIACLISKVADGILALAIEWMQTFAGI